MKADKAVVQMKKLMDCERTEAKQAGVPRGNFMKIRRLEASESGPAMNLVWQVFQVFEAPEYSPEGVRTFRRFITDPAALSELILYGAFEGNSLVGVLAIRKNGTHISLFFVDPAWHRKGVGRALFSHFLADSSAEQITVHSSPYAVEVYRRLGFRPTAEEQLTNGIRYTPMCYIRSEQ